MNIVWKECKYIPTAVRVCSPGFKYDFMLFSCIFYMLLYSTQTNRYKTFTSISTEP